MSKKNLVATIITSAVGFANVTVYIILMCLGIVPFFMSSAFACLLFFLFFLAAWAPVIINKIFKVNFCLPLIVAYDVFIVMGILVGTLWEVYDISLLYDKVVHLSSGILFAMLAYSLFASGKENRLSTAWKFVLIFSFAMMVGGVWEICEFTFDSLLDKNAQSWMGFVGHDVLMDTMLDLICDCCGALVGGISVAVFEWNKNRQRASKRTEIVCHNYERQSVQ